MSAREYLAGRGCTRLCHVTKLRNLPAILLEGLVCARDLAGDYRNDPARYDGAMDRVCCSLEYPNARYLQAVCRRDPDRVFREWTALYLGLEVLEREADFCPCNASRGKGAYIQKGLGEVARMFEDLPPGSVTPRPEAMLPCCPTDDQAEILIRDRIPPEAIRGLCVGSREVGERVRAMFPLLGVGELPIYVAPALLSGEWISMVRAGSRPEERVLEP